MEIVPSKIGRRYGYRRSRHKNMFAVRFGLRMAGGIPPLPVSVDLEPFCPPVYDQGQLGSCTANAVAGAYQFERMQAALTPLTPSRLFIYWNERYMEGDTADDTGAFGGDGITSLEVQGVPDESIWPYDITQFAVQPSPAAFNAALSNKVMQREVISLLDEIKYALVQKHLVPFGITLYENFESDNVAQTGIVPDPLPTEGVLGGHEMCICGYDDATQRFKVRNSWGPSFGMGGYCMLSYNYVISSGSDFEVITAI